ncbi:N-acetylmuramic acid 6-phosphate etherase [bacterium]|nr:N-acetylmuramic acid 6-phosphate etherase [bacterium]
MKQKLFEELKGLTTEQQNPDTVTLDNVSVKDALQMINNEDKKVALVVEKEIPYIAEAVNIVVNAFKNGGRLFYIGAGTSGRLGVLDASECPPTFGVDPEMVQGIMAGGMEALIRAQEGVEDSKESGAADLVAAGFTKNDVACGIAASMRTPFVIGAVEQANKIGAKTLYVTCTPREKLKVKVDVAICPVVGPEAIMGSTRMKSGTAQKLVLNMITTISMVRLGKVYENMMVDLQATNKKLEERSKKTVMTVTGVDYDVAEKTLHTADGHVKTAVVMLLADVSKEEAVSRLIKVDGFVRQAIRN